MRSLRGDELGEAFCEALAMGRDEAESIIRASQVTLQLRLQSRDEEIPLGPAVALLFFYDSTAVPAAVAQAGRASD